MIATVCGSGFIGTAIGLGAGRGCDLVARLTGRRFATGATRVRRHRADAQFADARFLATSCMQRHKLHDAHLAMIRHELVRNAASAAEFGRDL